MSAYEPGTLSIAPRRCGHHLLNPCIQNIRILLQTPTDLAKIHVAYFDTQNCLGVPTCKEINVPLSSPRSTKLSFVVLWLENLRCAHSPRRERREYLVIVSGKPAAQNERNFPDKSCTSVAVDARNAEHDSDLLESRPRRGPPCPCPLS